MPVCPPADFKNAMPPHTGHFDITEDEVINDVIDLLQARIAISGGFDLIGKIVETWMSTCAACSLRHQ